VTSLTPTTERGGAGDAAWSRRARGALRPKTVFLLAVLVVLAVYTEMAWDLEWRTAAGRIGPGFFPRIIGVLGMALTLVALVQTLRRPPEADEVVPLEDEVGEGDLGHHPVTMAVAVAASALFLVTLTTLGAILSSVLFMAIMLSLLNRGRWLVNAALSVLLPLALYLLFQTFLNAGLPEGVLPRF